MTLPSAYSYGAVLAVFRIYTGIFWLIHGFFGKVLTPAWSSPDGVCAHLITQMNSGTTGPYHDFVTTVVLPNITVFAQLVAWGETLTGVSLLLGLLSRLGGFVGAFLALNYWLAKMGFAQLDGYAGLDIAAFVLSILHLALPTGLVAGFDAIIAGRRRPVTVADRS